MQAIVLLDYLGTGAFAVSGALKGVRKEMDLFGVAVLATATAIGGGVAGDGVGDRTPPGQHGLRLAFAPPRCPADWRLNARLRFGRFRHGLGDDAQAEPDGPVPARRYLHVAGR